MKDSPSPFPRINGEPFLAHTIRSWSLNKTHSPQVPVALFRVCLTASRGSCPDSIPIEIM